MMREWALQDAKARLSEVVRLALEHEPQEITLRGEPAVVVLSREDYDHLTKPRESLVEFMRRSPLYGADDLDFARDPSLTREIEL
ncbi:type II toxin-antitoxin system Phd/YefM family antitoxin [Allochromatium vinosum]|uniref:type II toxin-antitoxin system Phd/YefM family antitoxin n=1 Tax=Allochromatium vinosum TaxID=1049 RepID=UPI001F5BE868|nr:type II toxin-antitoxin system Phd/YefM family antitoxin [Allochromatium vinosum]